MLNNSINNSTKKEKNILNLKELNTYNKYIKSYILKYNLIFLIKNIKKQSNLIKTTTTTNNLYFKNNILSILPNFKESILKNSLNINNISTKTEKENINKYINSIYINNFNYKNKIFTYNEQISYKFKNTNYNLFKQIYVLLFSAFLSMNSLISKPIFEMTSQKVIIHLFYYIIKENNNKFLNINKIKLNILCKILSILFNKPVKFELVRLHYPYFDSNIFLNILNILINKIQIRIIMQNFFKKAIIDNPISLNNKYLKFNIPSFLSGIKLKIGGRLMTHKVVPKQTIKIIRKGDLARGKIIFLDKARYTNKNKRGQFTLSISIGHYLNSLI
jgi:hypothetical protein